MAKPIEPTPTLEGKDAREFLEEIFSPVITKKEKAIFEETLLLERELKNK